MTSQSFLLYVLKLSMLSGIFVGYYWFALRNKRFHYYNRFYLLASVLLSLTIPLLQFDWVTNEKPVFMGSGETIDLIISGKSPELSSMSIWQISIILILLISSLLIVITGYHISKIYRLKNQSQITKLEGFDLMYTDEDSAPFSFLDNLFWKNAISIEDAGGKQIFKHELTHIQQKHTWDRLFTQLCCSIFWVNPFFWLIQKELETIHEFIADEAAVDDQGVEAFAKMLIQTHFGNHFFETKHSFFYSSIKRRLTMLTTTTNTKFSYLRRVMLLPLLLIGISVFSVRVHAKEKLETKLDAITESIFQKEIDTTKPPPPPPSLNERIRTTRAIVFLNGKEANKAELSKTLNPKEVIDVKSFSSGEATKKYGEKGKYGAIEIKSQINIKNELLLFEGKEITKTEFIKILRKKNQININILSAQDAIKKYGEKGKTGVAEITSIKNNPQNKEDYDRLFTEAQTSASFPGGIPAWKKYLETNLNRNIPVNKGAPPGKYIVVVSFVVDKNGGLSNVKAENDPGYGTAEEATRMITKGPKWVPASQDGIIVTSFRKQSITFQISEE